jgi:glycosyltransferase involved in cell wall biosynthesis
MKICLFSPYIPKHTGGGERYLFDVALTLAKNPKHSVTFAIPKPFFSNQQTIRNKYETFLGEALDNISFVSAPLGTTASFLQKLLWTAKWDVIYYATDGSLFFSLAKRNILHIQFPFALDKSSFLEQAKLANWHIKNTNSTFTKKIVEPAWPVSIDVVHHPQIPISLSLATVKKNIAQKEKIILHVGRFFRQLHCKKQDVLVDIFQTMEKKYPKRMKGWQLLLVGSVEDQSYADQVAAKISSKNITIIHTMSRERLLKTYQKASIYWHATGYGIDQKQFPEKVEHFGISTGEAMSYGCAPVVINKGGQPEVVGTALKKLLWQTDDECIATTIDLITNQKKLKAAQTKAHQTIQRFSPAVFTAKLESMIGAA